MAKTMQRKVTSSSNQTDKRVMDAYRSNIAITIQTAQQSRLVAAAVQLIVQQCKLRFFDTL